MGFKSLTLKIIKVSGKMRIKNKIWIIPNDGRKILDLHQNLELRHLKLLLKYLVKLYPLSRSLFDLKMFVTLLCILDFLLVAGLFAKGEELSPSFFDFFIEGAGVGRVNWTRIGLTTGFKMLEVARESRCWRHIWLSGKNAVKRR